VLVGFKVYVIEKGSRFEQAGFEFGDLIEKVNGELVTSDKGTRALYDNVVGGRRQDRRRAERHARSAHQQGEALTIAGRSVLRERGAARVPQLRQRRWGAVW
jgi:hypothetical protein